MIKAFKRNLLKCLAFMGISGFFLLGVGAESDSGYLICFDFYLFVLYSLMVGFPVILSFVPISLEYYRYPHIRDLLLSSIRKFTLVNISYSFFVFAEYSLILYFVNHYFSLSDLVCFFINYVLVFEVLYLMALSFGLMRNGKIYTYLSFFLFVVMFISALLSLYYVPLNLFSFLFQENTLSGIGFNYAAWTAISFGMLKVYLNKYDICVNQE